MQNSWTNILYQDEFIGNSPEIVQIRKSLPSLGRSDEHVTIIGEAGTEKLVAAKCIFENSPRVNQKLIITNASHLNTAFESEIWQPFINTQKSEDASLDQIEATLVIQEIESLHLDTQNSLLSLAHKGYLLNSQTNQPIQSNFRIIATATPNLHNALKQNLFNSELFLSLTSLSLKIPPLRFRKQDIPIIFEYFLKQICKENKRVVPPINFEVFNQLLKHDWQGNVKELENAVRTLVLYSPEGELIPDGLPFATQKEPFGKLEMQNLGMAISRLEKELIEKALRKFAGNQSKAAQALSISETNLRYKMKKLGLAKRDFSFGRNSV